MNIASLPHNTTGSTLLIPYDNSPSCGQSESFAPGLWYTIVGNGTGIEASLCDRETDFMAHISVYNGAACDELECLTASENDCKVSWLDEEGVKYNIRVHGVGASVGNFISC